MSRAPQQAGAGLARLGLALATLLTAPPTIAQTSAIQTPAQPSAPPGASVSARPHKKGRSVEGLPPALPVPTAWRGALADTDPVRAVDPQWWTAFGDPGLTKAVQDALAANPDVDLANAHIAQAQAAFRAARADARPHLYLAVSGGRARSLVLGQGLDATAGEPQTSLDQDLDVFGRLANRRAAAQAALAAAASDRDATALAVASAVAEGYIGLLGLDARLRIARQTLAARQEELRLARRRAQAGYISQLDLSQTQAEYQLAAQLTPALELAVARQENGLSLLMGVSPEAIARQRRLEDLRAPSIPVALPSRVLRRRADLFAAEQRLVASDHSLAAARAALLPDINLTASAGVAVSTALEHPVGLYSFGSSLLAPILGRGGLKAQRDAAVAGRQEAVALYRKTALNALGEAEDALAAINRLGQSSAAIDAQIHALEAAERLAARRYQAGYASHLDLLAAQRDLLAARLNREQVHTEALSAHVALYRALGGGWNAR